MTMDNISLQKNITSFCEAKNADLRKMLEDFIVSNVDDDGGFNPQPDKDLYLSTKAFVSQWVKETGRKGIDIELLSVQSLDWNICTVSLLSDKEKVDVIACIDDNVVNNIRLLLERNGIVTTEDVMLDSNKSRGRKVYVGTIDDMEMSLMVSHDVNARTLVTPFLQFGFDVDLESNGFSLIGIERSNADVYVVDMYFMDNGEAIYPMTFIFDGTREGFIRKLNSEQELMYRESIEEKDSSAKKIYSDIAMSLRNIVESMEESDSPQPL